MRFADLHIHTIFSDGTYTPPQVIAAADKAGLYCISITDHDSVDGIALTRQAAQGVGIEVISGIEMTAEANGHEVHILGYCVDEDNQVFLHELSELQQIRIERIYAMVEKLQGLGIVDISAQDVLDRAHGSSVGRMHLATLLKQRGHVATISEAFYRYIGDRGPAYVAKFRFSPKEIITMIRTAGGIAVVAHPHMLDDEACIAEFVEYGLQGIEAYYSEYSDSKIKRYLGIAKKFGLLVTGGSDSHGDAKENTPIGAVKIPYELVEELKKAR